MLKVIFVTDKTEVGCKQSSNSGLMTSSVRKSADGVMRELT